VFSSGTKELSAARSPNLPRYCTTPSRGLAAVAYVFIQDV
jgi:hypothetical protein